MGRVKLIGTGNPENSEPSPKLQEVSVCRDRRDRLPTGYHTGGFRVRLGWGRQELLSILMGILV